MLRNSWMKLDMKMPWNIGALYELLCIDGICHWYANSKNCDEHLLVSFNLNRGICLWLLLDWMYEDMLYIVECNYPPPREYTSINQNRSITHNRSVHA